MQISAKSLFKKYVDKRKEKNHLSLNKWFFLFDEYSRDFWYNKLIET